MSAAVSSSSPYRRRPVPSLYDCALSRTLSLIRKGKVNTEPHLLCPPSDVEDQQNSCLRCLLPLRIREDLLALATADPNLLDGTKLAVFEACLDPAVMTVRMRGFADADFARICRRLRRHGGGVRVLELDTPFPAADSNCAQQARHERQRRAEGAATDEQLGDVRQLLLLPAAPAGHYADLLDAFRSMSRLTSLALPGSADDEILRVVGEGCPTLVRLDVSFSYTVSDAGLLRFLASRPPCRHHRLPVEGDENEEETGDSKLAVKTTTASWKEFDEPAWSSTAMPRCSCLTYLNIWATSVTAAGLAKCLDVIPGGNLSTLCFHNADILDVTALTGGSTNKNNNKSSPPSSPPSSSRPTASRGREAADGAGVGAWKQFAPFLHDRGAVPVGFNVPKGGFRVRNLVLSRLPETYKMGQFVAFFPKLESIFVRGATTNLQMAHLLERRRLRCFKSNHLDGLINDNLITRWSNLAQINLRLPGVDVDVAAVAACCPLLEELRFENGMFVLGAQHAACLPPGAGFSRLTRLGLNTPLPIGEYESSYIFLPPSVIAFCLRHAPLLESADFGYCSALNDGDVDRLISGRSQNDDEESDESVDHHNEEDDSMSSTSSDSAASSWSSVASPPPPPPLNPRLERMTLRGAHRLTDAAIFKIIRFFPSLNVLAMKILPRARLAELERLKTRLRVENIDVTLMTYGNY